MGVGSQVVGYWSSTVQAMQLKVSSIFHVFDERDRQCLKDLWASIPEDDKTRIEQTKGGLLKDSYSWILIQTFNNGKTANITDSYGSKAILARARQCCSVVSLMN